MEKKHSTFRLSDRARRLLTRLAKADGITRTAVIEQLIRRASWERLGGAEMAKQARAAR